MEYDVFLSHNSKDKPAVEQIAHLLKKEYGFRCWLDKWNLVPGEPWQEALENALDQCQTVAVFVGPSAISPWENEEMRSALETRVSNQTRRVIPVLLPGAPDSQTLKLPRFLTRLTWVDFRAGLEDANALHRLYCGIQGISPGAMERKARPEGWTIGRRLTTQVWRLRQKRQIWMAAIAVVALVILVLQLSGNLSFDIPLFCGREFSSAPGYINLATEQRNDGRLACAIQNLQKALTVDPTPTETSLIYYKLASAFIVKPEPEPVKALEYASRGLAMDAAYQDLLHVSKGIAYCQMRQNAEAVQEFNIFLELNSDPASLLAKNVERILANLERGEDMSDYCWVDLGAASLP